MESIRVPFCKSKNIPTFVLLSAYACDSLSNMGKEDSERSSFCFKKIRGKTRDRSMHAMSPFYKRTYKIQTKEIR